MISFRRMKWLERLRLRLDRKRQLDYEANLKAAIHYLVQNPDQPCIIEGRLIKPRIRNKGISLAHHPCRR